MLLKEQMEFLRKTALFSGMDDGDLAQLAGDLQERCCAAGETVFYQGDPGDAAYIVVSGRVRVYVLSEEGQEVSMIMYGPGALFGELALIDRQPRSATIVAMEPTVLLVLNGRDFSRHLRNSYELALKLMLTLSARLRHTTEEVKSLATLDVSERIIRKLLDLARHEGVTTDRGIRLRCRLTQHELASLVGSSRESTNRAMRALVRQGLIDFRQGYITLLKPAKLEQMVPIED